MNVETKSKCEKVINRDVIQNAIFRHNFYRLLFVFFVFRMVMPLKFKRFDANFKIEPFNLEFLNYQRLSIALTEFWPSIAQVS